jgi:hypothetical protein
MPTRILPLPCCTQHPTPDPPVAAVPGAVPCCCCPRLLSLLLLSPVAAAAVAAAAPDECATYTPFPCPWRTMLPLRPPAIPLASLAPWWAFAAAKRATAAASVRAPQALAAAASAPLAQWGNPKMHAAGVRNCRMCHVALQSRKRMGLGARHCGLPHPSPHSPLIAKPFPCTC